MLEHKYSIHVSNHFNINHDLPEASQPFQSPGGEGAGGDDSRAGGRTHLRPPLPLWLCDILLRSSEPRWLFVK